MFTLRQNGTDDYNDVDYPDGLFAGIGSLLHIFFFCDYLLYLTRLPIPIPKPNETHQITPTDYPIAPSILQENNAQQFPIIAYGT